MSDVVIGIQARMGSTRFPGKVLAELGGKEILRRVGEAAVAAAVGEVVLLLGETGDDDERLSEWARYGEWLWEEGDPCFPLVRFVYIDTICNAKYVVRLNADCPFYDPQHIRTVADVIQQTDADYVGFCKPDGTPAILTHQGLPEAFKLSSLKSMAEHVTAGFYTLYTCEWIEHPCDENNTVDTPEDLARLEARCSSEANA